MKVQQLIFHSYLNLMLVNLSGKVLSFEVKLKVDIKQWRWKLSKSEAGGGGGKG